LTATVTYENTTDDFAAATVTADPQGLRIYYYTLAPGRRTIGIVPWELEAGGTYRLVYGIDAGDDGKIDIITEQRDFVFPQHGSPVQIDVESRTNYVVEIDQLQRGELIGPAPDPGLSAQDTRYNPARNLPTARIYNVSFHNLFETSKSPSMTASRPRAGSLLLCSRSQISKIPMIWSRAW
jgi:hypothetical protein